jgi:hypothetical protein
LAAATIHLRSEAVRALSHRARLAPAARILGKADRVAATLGALLRWTLRARSIFWLAAGRRSKS